MREFVFVKYELGYELINSQTTTKAFSLKAFTPTPRITTPPHRV